MKKPILILIVAVILILGYVSVGYAPTDPMLTAAKAGVTGLWNDIDDRNMIAEYRGDGTYVESYASADGEVRTDGTWKLVMGDKLKNAPFDPDADGVYMERTIPEGTFYFRVDLAADGTLKLTNMTKGGGTHYARMNGHEFQDGIEE